ncbi:MAG: YicC/YloC family endoribonuclease [Bacillota bacterium]
MIRSMTGYGRGEASGPDGRLVAEIRAVNHRFAEVVVRLPRSLTALEDRVRRMVQQQVARGRVEVTVTWEEGGERPRRVKVDKDLALAYYNALREIASVTGSKIEITSDSLARWPDVLTVEEAEVDPESQWPVLAEALAGALAGLVAMREREGEALAADLRARLDRVAELVAAIGDRAPLVVQEYRERLSRRLDELLGPGVVDPARLAQEVAIFADRCDITEELKRLQSHLSQFRAELDGESPPDGGPRPVGRKLDFLVQEMGREINTVGAKAQDLAIAAAVVEVKTELEKIREQVQNIE